MPAWLKPALDYLPQWLELQVAETQLPGCAFAVTHRGKLVLERAFGVADLETHTALTPKHRFRVASHSKSFTATGIMRLVEARKLRLNAPVGKYVSGLHDRIAATTLRQLLSHGAGVHRDGRDSGQWDLRRPFLDTTDLRADLQTAPTLAPDARFKYSNHAFGLLGLVIESVTGTPYTKWIRDEVIEPAGLTHTQPDVPVAARTPMSNGYTARMPFGRRPVGRDLPTHALASATGFVSTAGDLARFFSQLDPKSDSKLLSVASRRAMTRAHRDIPGLPHGREYGLGIARGKVGATPWFGHSGGFPGFLTRTCVLPSLDVAFSVLTNAIDGPSQQWSDGAIDILATFAKHGAPKAIDAALDRPLVEHLGRVRSRADGRSRAGLTAQPGDTLLRRYRIEGTRRQRANHSGRRIRNVRRIGANRARQSRPRDGAVAWRRAIRPRRRRFAQAPCAIERPPLNVSLGLSHHYSSCCSAPTIRPLRSIVSSRTSGIGRASLFRTGKN